MSEDDQPLGAPAELDEHEAVLVTLPRDKYRVVETEDGWDVYGDADPSFG